MEQDEVKLLMYENSLNLLKTRGVKFKKGLTYDELSKIEKIYKIKFPNSLKEFLMTILPVSKGFYDWSNMDNSNIEYIKRILDRPILDIYTMVEEIYWCDSWGEEPGSKKEFEEEVRKRLKNAPGLLPVYSHRYIPMISDNDPPVFSICGTDIIYYGENLEDYFNIEFGTKSQSSIKLQKIVPVPFWSEIM